MHFVVPIPSFATITKILHQERDAHGQIAPFYLMQMMDKFPGRNYKGMPTAKFRPSI